MMKRRILSAFQLTLLFLLFVSALAEGKETALVGEWVCRDETKITVITLNENGSAVYGGLALSWRNADGALLLTDGTGETIRIIYEETENGLTAWLPTRFTRISEIGKGGEITGTWKADGKSDSSFVFTEDSRFLEDGVFTGSFVQDSESGKITLKYVMGMFEDTVIYYSFDGDAMVISYPWQLVRK